MMKEGIHIQWSLEEYPTHDIVKIYAFLYWIDFIIKASQDLSMYWVEICNKGVVSIVEQFL